MFDTLILLTGPAEASALSAVVRFRNPTLNIRHVATGEELDAIANDVLARSRLIGFATAVIVQARVLEALGFGAYNFHPGPPSFPGWAPCNFAVYEQATMFGATAHHMIARVDAGPIVGIDLFPILAQATVADLDEMTLVHLARLFWGLAEALTTRAEPLDALPISWSGIKRTRRDYRALCDMPEDIDREELARRVAAFGRGDYGYHLTVTRHGQRFRYEAAPDAKTFVEPVATAPIEIDSAESLGTSAPYW